MPEPYFLVTTTQNSPTLRSATSLHFKPIPQSRKWPKLPSSSKTSPSCNPLEITLQPLTLSDSDVDHFMVWATNEKVTKFCTWDTFTSKESAIIYIQNTIIPHPWFRAICLAGRPVGYVLFIENKGNDRCKGEVGYGLGSEFWGRGIITQVVKMVAKSVFKEFPHLEGMMNSGF